MKKTIGGDRLGSGNKMKVHLHNYERSTHDLSHTWKSTMSAGTLVPFLKLLVQPGDKIDIDLFAEVLTLPTLGPLFGSYKVQLDIFEVPARLFQGKLHMNLINIGYNMENVHFPQIVLQHDYQQDDYLDDNSQINPSSIFKYLGISGLGVSVTDETIERWFNAIPYLGYFEIFKNYYANKMEENAYIIHNDRDQPSSIAGTNAKWVKRDGTESGGNWYSTPQDFALSEIKEFKLLFTSELPKSGISWESKNIIVTDGQGAPTPISLGIMFRQSQVIGDFIVLSDLNPNLANIYPFLTEEQTWSWDNVNYVYNYNTDSEPIITAFPLANIDRMREEILTRVSQDGPVTIGGTNASTQLRFTPYNLPFHKGAQGWSKNSNQEGLLLKTYQSDLFTNFIDKEIIDGENGITAISSVKIDPTTDSFSIDQLNLAYKVYKMLNRIALSGGTYDDYLDAVYTHERAKAIETPVYHGGLIKKLSFQEVVSNSEATGNDGNVQPLGTLAGRGRAEQNQKGGYVSIKANEVGYIMGIISITPYVDYSQGNDFDMNLKNMAEVHTPALDGIAFQDLETDKMGWFSTVLTDVDEWTTGSIGKQPAWLDYMTAVNKCYGNFAVEGKEMFMTLNRRFKRNLQDQTLEFTTYIDPTLFNNIFAQSNLDAMNFWVQVGLGITARRKISAKQIPNL